jgi:alkanesulfonate monooxygenase SsuD/methylene tetrahydromethanopterin reductase-like flavin-dependent oxidoreductase (luciferase family)
MPGQSAMPAAGGSTAAVHVLSARLGEGPMARAAASLPGLAEFLAAVPDHRRAQGRRHSLVSGNMHININVRSSVEYWP